MRRSQRDPDAQGIPVMRFHDPMLGCQRKLEGAFHNVKHFMAQQQRLLDDHRQRNQNGSTGSSNGGNGGPEYCAEDEQWGVDKEPGFSGPDPKKIRRGVSSASCLKWWDVKLTILLARCTAREMP